MLGEYYTGAMNVTPVVGCTTHHTSLDAQKKKGAYVLSGGPLIFTFFFS